MGMNKLLRSRSGDTLVEVMASIFIFLLMMGILQGAVSYSSAAMRKNQEIRQENAEILKKLAETDATKWKENPVTLTWYPVNADLTQIGTTNSVFQSGVLLYEKNVDGVSFPVYQALPTQSGGDGS